MTNHADWCCPVTSRMITWFFILSIVLLLSWPPLLVLAEGQGSADPDQDRIRDLFQRSDQAMAKRDYSVAVKAMADIFALIDRRASEGRNGSGDEAIRSRALNGLAVMQSRIAQSVESVLNHAEKELRALTAINEQDLIRLDQLQQSLAYITPQPGPYTKPVRKRLGTFIQVCHVSALMEVPSDKQQANLELVAKARAAADAACAAADFQTAEPFVQEAERVAGRLDTLRDEAEIWRGLRNKRTEEGGIDALYLDRLRRELDRVDNEIAETKELSREYLRLVTPVYQEWSWLQTLYKELDKEFPPPSQFKDGLTNWIAAYSFTTAYKAVAHSPAESWQQRLISVESALQKRENRLRPLADSIPPAGPRSDVFDLHFKFAEVDTQSLRDLIDDTEKEIDSTDRFAALCIQAAEDIQSDLKRARLCLRTIQIKAQPVTTALTPATPPAPAPAPVAAPAANPAPPAPAGPPAGVPAGNAPTPPAADPNPPPIRDDVAGGIQIRGGSQRIAVGQRARFIATDMGNRPYTNVIWNSYDEELLAIGPDGTATGLRPGRVTIQAKLADGSGTLATYELEVVIPDKPGSPPKPAPGAQPPTGSAPPGTAASGTAPTADADGGFDDRGLQVGGDQPAQLPEPDGGFGDRGLEITTKPASSGHAQSSGGDQPPPGPNANPPGRGAVGSAAGAGAAAIRPLNWQGGPQPAAWHIFATGSRMGWAAAYGRYTDGLADQDIIDHLLMAGEHAMWANRQSYPPHPAWPEWQQIRLRCRDWAGDVLQCPRGEYREQVSLAVASYADSLAEQITFQVIGDRIQTPNCDGVYMRLGYNLAYGQTSLQLAAGAQQAGQTRIADRARQDAVTHLRRAVQVLLQYEQTTVVSGRCADLRDVRTEIESLVNLNDLDTRIRMVRHAWETASERIRALSGAAAPPSPTAGTGQTTPGTAPAGSPTLWADPGELEGVWVSPVGRYRFVKQGSEYVGTLEHIFSPPENQNYTGILMVLLARQGYVPGEVVFRGTKTGSQVYRGRFHSRCGQRLDPKQGNKGWDWMVTDRQIEVAVVVMGDYLAIESPAERIEGVPWAVSDVGLNCLREKGTVPVPDFDALSYDARLPIFCWNSGWIWFLASRRADSGEEQTVLFHDYRDARVQAITDSRAGAAARQLSQLKNQLASADPAWKTLQDYMKANEGLPRRLEQAGFKVIFGPGSKEVCYKEFMKSRGLIDPATNLFRLPAGGP